MGIVRWEENPLEVIAYILISALLIFYLDIITPLGLVVWVLYFIPLFLTLFLRGKYASYLGAGIFILLIAISFFLSPRDMSELFALVNRVFFAVLLIVTAFFIAQYKQTMENLRNSEERYRYLTEWSPVAILVQEGGKILYINPAGIRLFAGNKKEDLIGKDLVQMIFPDSRDSMQQRMAQALLGAKMQIPEIGLVRFDGKDIRVEAWLGEIIWDGRPAVQIIFRAVTNK
jgi:PAS domain S-box-containing protein